MAKKIKIRPPFIAIDYILIALALDYFLNSPKIIESPVNYTGVLLIVLGISLIVRAAKAFKKAGTPRNPFEKPTALATDGPFRFSRNPMYVGLFVILLGISVFNGSIIVFLAPIAFIITIRVFFVSKEERVMEELFGKEYLEYKSKVRRWL